MLFENSTNYKDTFIFQVAGLYKTTLCLFFNYKTIKRSIIRLPIDFTHC